MWIKEIIIEGFKSYATRTVISHLDPEFNAITGLNGSGKSNILDAILFCLGLSKEYDTLRIKKLQELIYKNGTAGIIKAEVSLILDNRNKKDSPIGYQEFDKITVTRQITADKSRYFINGKAETQKTYKDMFRSVQLNIDNPHFLVAQGRITKIINLKPPELIGMLEETAGTSLYNEKKRETQKVLQKKEEKLKQVQELIETEIQPQIQKLTEERAVFQLWRAQETQINQLKTDLLSWEFIQKSRSLKIKQGDYSQVSDQIVGQEDKMRYENTEISNLQESIQKLQDANRGSKYNEIVEQHKEKTKLVAALDKAFLNTKKQQETIEEDKIKLEHLLRNLQIEKERTDLKITNGERNLKQMQNELDTQKNLLNEQLGQQNAQEDGTMVQNTTQMIQRQMNDTLSHIQSHRKDLEQTMDRLNRIDNQMTSSKVIFETVQREASTLEDKITSIRSRIDKGEKELLKYTSLDSQLQNLQADRREFEAKLMEVKNKIALQPSYFQLNLSRMKDWDQKRVYGKLFNLFEVKDENYMKALEFGAGAKLQNVVVDDSNTSTYLLKNNILQSHAYIVPNKEIQFNEAKREFVEVAAQISQEMGGFARPAIDLISYHEKVTNTMKFVFGNFMIASSMEIATKIAYHQSNVQKLKVVTKDGDIVDPSGTLTGGYTNERQQLLPRYKQVNKLTMEYNEIQGKIQQLEQEIDQIRKDMNYAEQIKQGIKQDKYELEQFADKQRKSSKLNYQAEQTKLNNEKSDLEVEKEKLSKLVKEAETKLAELKKEQQMMLQGKNTKELLQTQVNRTKKEIEDLKQQLDKMKGELFESREESQNYVVEIKKNEKKLQEEVQNLQKTAANNTRLLEELTNAKVNLEKLTQEKNNAESKNAILNNDIARLSEQLNERQKYLNATLEMLTNLKNEHKKLHRELHDLKQELKQLEDENDFIRAEKDELLQDILSEKYKYFEHFEYEKNKQQYQRLQHDQGKLGKQVNFKVEAMTEQVEKEFQILKEKQNTLIEDKNIIVSNIRELDEKKIKTIEKCFETVNKDFSQIFGSLLQKAEAKLSRLEGKSIEEGIEIIVSFNHKEKNLSELSGGQRSLIALSFILALLKCKPAPFYILDEVDSALDLSHTENIGEMLAQNFKQSQFLLISLKEGMYQNANVLFRVLFLDGVSKIDRYELKKKKQIK